MSKDLVETICVLYNGKEDFTEILKGVWDIARAINDTKVQLEVLDLLEYME